MHHQILANQRIDVWQAVSQHKLSYLSSMRMVKGKTVLEPSNTALAMLKERETRTQKIYVSFSLFDKEILKY